MKKWGIIGALLFAGAVVFGYFCNFPAATIIESAVAAFGLCAVIVSALKGAKEKKIATWKTIVVIVFATIGGVVCCLGGLAQNIFAETSGAALALLAVIFGMIYAPQVNNNNSKNYAAGFHTHLGGLPLFYLTYKNHVKK